MKKGFKVIKSVPCNTQCVYRILNLKTKKFYFGSTNMFPTRMKKHYQDLTNGDHNFRFQEAFDTSEVDDWEATVIWTREYCTSRNKTHMHDIEQALLDMTILGRLNVATGVGKVMSKNVTHPDNVIMVRRKSWLRFTREYLTTYRKPISKVISKIDTKGVSVCNVNVEELLRLRSILKS